MPQSAQSSDTEATGQHKGFGSVASVSALRVLGGGGKAYLETYDSRGRSFQRRTGTFEVTTEKKSGDDEIAVLSFAPTS